jgi:hypothetical protein
LREDFGCIIEAKLHGTALVELSCFLRRKPYCFTLTLGSTDRPGRSK